MPVNSAAENVLATIGTVLWTGQLIPQVWKSYRSKSTDGLSPWLMFIWATSAIFLGIYVIVQNINIPLIVQPQSFGALASLSWAQCLYYEKKVTGRTCVIIYILYLAIFGGFEAGITYAVRGVKKGNTRPLDFIGVFGGIGIIVGLLPQFWEIYKRREVIGISLIFMTIDTTGGIFNALSLVFKEKFDGIAAMSFIGVAVLDSLVLLCAAILNPRAKRRRAREQAAAGEDAMGDMETGGSSTVEDKSPAADPRQSLAVTVNGSPLGAESSETEKAQRSPTPTHAGSAEPPTPVSAESTSTAYCRMTPLSALHK
ncbi:hypothetical protein BOTBODRAFT_162876 [Botryobasidium botryosum FD-172 SS1]|uniref:PQ-loop-domain-containing protein n=1 Tax=Botryobasidium botryosum (strain FD-172 SS1) TaxID=930990 RepID=A0A067M9J7_BOTB1|nr:hypothetical protein BOTBODRAFT_162876 [Botryobasidium botryosum FD-172 SS1]